MRIGVQFKPEDWPVLREQVVTAERLGYSRIYLVDGQLLWRDIYVYMTQVLAATERIPVASAVTNPFTRHFTVTANAHATLAELHPGRVVLGLGRGDNAVRTLGLEPVSTSSLADVVSWLRGLMAGRAIGYNGRQIRIVWEPKQPVPIMMAATGPRNLRLAGSLADIVIIQVGANPDACGWAIDHIRSGAQAAGRSMADIEVVVHCAIHISDNLEEARRETRWIAELVGLHAAAVARMSKDHGMPEPLMRLANLELGHYDYASHLDDRVERAPYPDEVIDDVAMIGRAEQIAERIRALERVGVTEVAPAYLNGSSQVSLIGEQLIPLFG